MTSWKLRFKRITLKKTKKIKAITLAAESGFLGDNMYMRPEGSENLTAGVCRIEGQSWGPMDALLPRLTRPHPHPQLQPPYSVPGTSRTPLHYFFSKKVTFFLWSWVLATHGIFSMLKHNSCPLTRGILVPQPGIRLLTTGPAREVPVYPISALSNPGNTVPTTNLPWLLLTPQSIWLHFI